MGELRIPVGLAFFLRTGEPERVFALYPSPAGATESEIDPDAWERLQELNPALDRLEPDSEALIVNRMSEPHQHAVVPIDECYRLVGMIKSSWEGISGGPGPEEAIGRSSPSSGSRQRPAASCGGSAAMSEGDRLDVEPRPRPVDLLAEGPDRATPQDRPDPEFEIVAARSLARTATPTLSLTARISDASGIEIYTAALSVLLTIEPGRRRHEPAERERLVELFGEPDRWQATTEALRWTQVDVLAPSFSGETHLEIPVPCSFDHEIAATKYFAGLDDGVIPLRLHFNGTVFYRGRWAPSGDAAAVGPLGPLRPSGFHVEGDDRPPLPGGGLDPRLRRDAEAARTAESSAAGSPTFDGCVAGLLDRDRRGGGDDE